MRLCIGSQDFTEDRALKIITNSQMGVAAIAYDRTSNFPARVRARKPL